MSILNLPSNWQATVPSSGFLLAGGVFLSVLILVITTIQQPCRDYFEKSETDNYFVKSAYEISKQSAAIIGGFNIGLLVTLSTSNLTIRKASLFFFSIILIFASSQSIFYYNKITPISCPLVHDEIQNGKNFAIGYLSAGVGIMIGLTADTLLDSISFSLKIPTIIFFVLFSALVLLIPAMITNRECKTAILENKEGTEGLEDVADDLQLANTILAWTTAVVFLFFILATYFMYSNFTPIESEEVEQLDILG